MTRDTAPSRPRRPVPLLSATRMGRPACPAQHVGVHVNRAQFERQFLRHTSPVAGGGGPGPGASAPSQDRLWGGQVHGPATQVAGGQAMERRGRGAGAGAAGRPTGACFHRERPPPGLSRALDAESRPLPGPSAPRGAPSPGPGMGAPDRSPSAGAGTNLPPGTLFCLPPGVGGARPGPRFWFISHETPRAEGGGPAANSREHPPHTHSLVLTGQPASSGPQPGPQAPSGR